LNLTSLNAAQRLACASAFGLVVGAIASFFFPWPVATLIAWDSAALALGAWTWIHLLRLTPEETQTHAVREDTTRLSTDLGIVVASIASLAGVGYAIAQANNTGGLAKFGFTILGVSTVVVSWFAVQTAFTARYAHLYYTPPIGGIDFKTRTELPDYHDFAYVAFTVGMTFQVSDTDVQQRVIRRTVLRQALVSYLFGAVIIAVTVNTVANLLQ
jgi:uncharacterized membrane protein